MQLFLPIRAVAVQWLIAAVWALPAADLTCGPKDPTWRPNSNACLLSDFAEAMGNQKGRANRADEQHLLTLRGLDSPAMVSGSVSISVAGAPSGATITYCLDGVSIWGSQDVSTSHKGEHDEIDKGFSLSRVSLGEHNLQAVSTAPDGAILRSNQVTLHVVRTMNAEFSPGLTAYALQPTVQQPLSSILEHTATRGAGLTQGELDTRSQIAAMYMNLGIDLSLDYAADQSTLLMSRLPADWAKPDKGAKTQLSMRFSPDAPFYHSIPSDWPRVKLPRGYLKTVQLNTSQGGDGIGYGIVAAGPDSPTVAITSMWYEQEDTRKTFSFRLPTDWRGSLPSLEAGDRHMILVDPRAETFVSLYKTSVNTKTGLPSSLYASSPTSFDSLGDRGGSTASQYSELPLLIQPGEATSDQGAIRHAIGGPVGRAWAARTYPATARDYGVLSSTNSCTGKGMTNTGVVPYGGIIQLDPSLDLARLKLSRPALRILRAMQTYGYYVMDFGCADLDIYTAISEKELNPYGGLYGSSRDMPGVQAEIARVITTSNLYVVPPLTKRPE